MSLGFNQLRRPYYTNLPGAVGANVVRRSPTRRAQPPAPRPVVSLPEKKAAPVKMVAATPPPPPSTTSLATLFEETQWVYATAQVALTNDADETVASEGDRVVLVYPMRTDASTGRVSMRLKTVHPTTGALAHTWVSVYDPDAETPHLVTGFSLLP